MDEDIQDEYARLLETNTIVAAIGTMVDNGIDEVEAMKAGIVNLAKMETCLSERVSELIAIVPRRFQMPDGKLLRWDAPDELVPAILADLAQTGIIESSLNPQPDTTHDQEKNHPQKTNAELGSRNSEETNPESEIRNPKSNSSEQRHP